MNTTIASNGGIQTQLATKEIATFFELLAQFDHEDSKLALVSGSESSAHTAESSDPEMKG